MKYLVKACTALAAFAALAVMPSAASASPELTDPAGTRAPVGSLFEANNVAHAATPTALKMTTSMGNIECTTATMTGTVVKNSGTVMEGEITTAQFLGTAGVSPHTTHCTGTPNTGSVTITPSHSSNPSHNGVASLPWCVKAEGLQDQFTIRGGKCAEAARPLTLSIHSSFVGACSYQRASMTGTYTTAPAEAIVTVQTQVFTRNTGSAFCPAEGSLDMAFTLKTDGTNTPFTIS